MLGSVFVLPAELGGDMGSKNLDRISTVEWRAKCETVADLARDRIEVISVCGKCDLRMTVDLRLIARVSGPATSLWNRKAPCKRIGCSGVVVFRAKFWGRNTYTELSAPWPAGR
jgi:hypothetical protein